MDEATNVAPGGGEGAPAPTVVTPAADTPQELTLTQAARALAAARNKPKEAQESAPAATEQPKLADEANADPSETEAPSEETTEAEPAQEPPIERPRSWTKDEDAEWQSLPRAMQQKIVAREQERDTGVRRSQNEAANERKAIEAERSKTEQVRQQYEARLPAIEQLLLSGLSDQFSDIKTMDDVIRMAAEDPFRKIQWDTHQQRLQAVQFERREADNRQAQERQSQWSKHVQTENELAAEKNPELSDPVKAKQLQSAAVEHLHEKGFTDQELTKLASGEDKLSIYDHRIQSLILDAMKYRDVQKAPLKAVPKVVPQVQRPGVAPPKGAAASEQLQALTAKLERSGSLKDAQALRTAQLKARARA